MNAKFVLQGEAAARSEPGEDEDKAIFTTANRVSETTKSGKGKVKKRDQ